MAKMINLTLDDIDAVYQHYIPALSNGGIFLPTDKEYKMGDKIFIIIKMPDDSENIPVTGIVSVIHHKAVSHGKARGVGLMFDPSDNGVTRGKIETLLAGHAPKNRSYVF